MDPYPQPTLSEIEHAAYGAWPAERVTEIGGWRLRYMREVTRRANSVWPLSVTDTDRTELSERVARVEEYYRKLGSSQVLFQLSPLAPSSLDSVLAERGYRVDAPVSVMLAEVSTVIQQAPRGNVCIEPTPGSDFLEVAIQRGRYKDFKEEFLGLLSRVQGRAGFASVETNGRPVASGLGVCDGPLLGLFAISTISDARRRGAASGLLGGLCRWAERKGARHAYLQVEQDNTAALKLFTRHGFREVYSYHYRQLELED